MKSIEEIYKQLTHLSRTISQCNHINYTQREDLVHDAVEKIIKKYNEGVLEDDFQKIKGYNFLVMRNCCTQWKMKLKPDYTNEEISLSQNFYSEFEETNHRNYLMSLVDKYINTERYSDVERTVFDMLITDHTREEINNKFDFKPNELKNIVYRLKAKLKVDSNRKLRYLIKNKENKDMKIPCYNRKEVYDYFKSYNQRHMSAVIYNGLITKNGDYVEVLYKENKE
jgi:DNA-directed RNA polymerase specialized sigma24 family protein